LRKLLDFLISKRHWFLFLLLEIVSIILVYRNNSYQRSIFFSSANVAAGYVSSISSRVGSYINLRKTNRDLLERNGRLEMLVLELQDRLDMLIADTSSFKGFSPDSSEQFAYSFYVASVVNNSVTQPANYITIDKGFADGIREDMGVVSDHGVVGIVAQVSQHYAVVLSTLNPKFHLSCKVKDGHYFGFLTWNGRDARYGNMEELPRHVSFHKGDLIVTSGYSSVFPPGIIVGVVEKYAHQHDDNFYTLSVRLATKFASLKNVRIIKNYPQKEQLATEKEAVKNDE